MTACGDDDATSAGNDATSADTGIDGVESGAEANEGTETTTPQEAQTVRFGSTSENPHSIPRWVATEEGMFEAHGIALDVVQFQGGGASVAAAVSAGDVDILTTGGTSTVAALANDVYDVKYIAQRSASDYVILTNDESIDSLEELCGQVVGIGGLGAQDHYVIRAELLARDLDPDCPDYIDIGPISGRLAALLGGQVVATTIGAADLPLAEEEGAHALVTPDEATASLPSYMIAARTDFIESNPELVQGVIDAMQEGVAFIREPENRDRVMEICANYATPERCERYMAWHDGDEDRPYSWSDTLEVDVEGIGLVIDTVAQLEPEAADLVAEDIVDNSFATKPE